MTRDSWVRGALVLGAAAGVFILERRLRARPYREAWSRHTARNLTMAAVAAATVRIVEMPLVLPMAALVDRRGWGLTALIGGPRWVRAVVALALLDYTLYIWHIATHRVSLLWRFHLVHHVDLDLDATTALRFHGGELALSVPWRLAQIAAIGVAPGVLLLWQSLTLASILFHHSNTALPGAVERGLGWFVVTPRMHAIHHSTDRAQRDRNFSSGLAVWDRLHRTLRLDAQPGDVAIGVAGYLDEGEVTLPRILALPLQTTEASRDTEGTETL